MERWEDLRRPGRDAHTTVVASTGSYHRSFSSSLLDAIYRSIDDGTGTAAAGGRDREWNVVVDAAVKPPAPHRATVAERQRTTTSSPQKPGQSRRGGGADAMNDQPQLHHRGGSCRKQQQHHQRQRVFANSTSSSSDSSYGGFSSSSDAEKAAPPVVDLSATTPRPRPIRTSRPPPEVSRKEKKKLPKDDDSAGRKAEGSIGDRFRASKLYRELKKAKTPASPGARLASFLNTLFATAGSTNKKAAAAKEAATGGADASLCSSASSHLSRTPSTAGSITKKAAAKEAATGSADASLCSSASSYSRSRLSRTPSSAGSTNKKAATKEAATGSADASLCFSASSYSRSRLSRTPSSAGKAAPDARRPIRFFFPLSFAVDDDCRPRGHRGAYAADQYLTRRGYPPAAAQVAEVRRPTREATREFIRGYEEQSRVDERDECEAAEVDEDDDTASYSSSDLFELENLKAIGGAGGELPVYETTRLEADSGMAQGPGVQRKIEVR